MPARSAPASTRATLKALHAQLKRAGRPTRRRCSRSPREARGHWVQARSWSPRCRSANGRPTAASATRSSTGCAPTSRPRDHEGGARAGGEWRRKPRRPRRRRRRPPRASAATRRPRRLPMPKDVRISNPERVIDTHDRHHQAGPGELLPAGVQADPAAPAEAPGGAGARARRASSGSCSSRSMPRR